MLILCKMTLYLNSWPSCILPPMWRKPSFILLIIYITSPFHPSHSASLPVLSHTRRLLLTRWKPSSLVFSPSLFVPRSWFSLLISFSWVKFLSFSHSNFGWCTIKFDQLATPEFLFGCQLVLVYRSCTKVVAVAPTNPMTFISSLKVN